jgi:hypothetical protein
LTNSNPLSPPISVGDWLVIGTFGDVTSIVEGLCNEIIMMLNPLTNGVNTISSTVTKNDTICGCDGSIMILAGGGYPPYQFSIDGGLTNQGFPIFNKLCQGTYTTTITDSSGFSQNNLVTINPPLPPTTYTINLISNFTTSVDNTTTLTKNYTTEVVVSPPLPDGVTIEFDLVHTNTYNTSPSPESSSNISNSELNKNSSVVPNTYSTTTTGTTFNPIDGCQENTLFITGNSEVWQNLTFNNSDVIIINTTTSIIKSSDSSCYLGSSTDSYSIVNAKIYGCSCCTIQNISI